MQWLPKHQGSFTLAGVKMAAPSSVGTSQYSLMVPRGQQDWLTHLSIELVYQSCTQGASDCRRGIQAAVTFLGHLLTNPSFSLNLMFLLLFYDRDAQSQQGNYWQQTAADHC